MRTRKTLALLLLPLLAVGCTHTQLRYSTTHQSDTVTRIYEQQVLNNLAMFVVNNDAVPHFAIASDGSTDVSDKGMFALGPINTPEFKSEAQQFELSAFVEEHFVRCPVS